MNVLYVLNVYNIRTIIQFHCVGSDSLSDWALSTLSRSGYVLIPSWTRFGYGQISIETVTHSLAPDLFWYGLCTFIQWISSQQLLKNCSKINF